MTDDKPERIVAEISKTWPHHYLRMDGPDVLAQRFEAIIERNRDRGYVLESWHFNSTATHDGQLIETIIAVFVRRIQP